jgi:hypothetical protein
MSLEVYGQRGFLGPGCAKPNQYTQSGDKRLPDNGRYQDGLPFFWFWRSRAWPIQSSR